MQPVETIHTLELFPELSAELLSLLRNLSPLDWEKETVCAGWSVKDVAAHLLGGNLGRLSFGRDRKPRTVSPAPLKSYGDLVNFINQQNADWVAAADRISPNLLIEFLELTDPQVYTYFKSLPLFEMGGLAVAWAGDAQSPRWFDVAREYTEKWLHQQHIREAVGAPVLAERKWLFPVLDTFIRALPFTYRGVNAVEGTTIGVHVAGEAGGDWALVYQQHAWQLFAGRAPETVSQVSLDQDLAWRLFTKGITPEQARARIEIKGDVELGQRILEMVSIMA